MKTLEEVREFIKKRQQESNKEYNKIMEKLSLSMSAAVTNWMIEANKVILQLIEILNLQHNAMWNLVFDNKEGAKEKMLVLNDLILSLKLDIDTWTKQIDSDKEEKACSTT